MRPLLRSTAALLSALAFGAVAARASEPVTFSVIGDVPYRQSELNDLQQHIENHNRYSPSIFLAHLGDIKSESEACEEGRYKAVADILKTSAVPVFIVPGDNEWVNCASPAQGWAWWEKHLLGLEQNFCGIWPVEAQAARPENFSFVRNGVLFLGLNYVSGTPAEVVQADVDWVNAQFAAYGPTARAAVLMAQKEPGGSLLDAVKARGRSFGKPVLYIHGNGHAWEVDPSFFGASNMLRVQVDRGKLQYPPVKVTVMSDGTFVFDRNPWPAGTPEVVRPPCSSTPALSIDDRVVAEGQTAVFTVSLANPTGAPVSVAYATTDGTARAGEDYQARSGTLSFSGSIAQQQVAVTTLQDTSAEPPETFFVDLANASGAALAKARGSAVIEDDDSPPPPSMGPSLVEVASGGSVSSSVVATSAPLVGTSGDLYLAAVASKPSVSVAGVTGLGLTWTPVRSQCGGRGQTGLALFRAQGVPTANGAVSASLSTAPSAAVIHVAHYTGTSSTGSIGSIVSANSNGVSGACSGGVDGASYAFDLATGANDSLVFVAASMRSKDHLPGSGYTEIAESYAGSSGSTAGGSLAERLLGSAGTVSVNGGFDGATDWSVVSAELRAGAASTTQHRVTVSSSGSGSVTLSPSGGLYAAGTLVTLTAIPASGYAFAGWGGALSGTLNPATLVVDADKSVTATFVPAVRVTVTTSGSGSVTLTPSGGSYPPGTLVTFTAVPAAGAAFLGWGGALGGTANPASLVVHTDVSVSASFTSSYALSVSTKGKGSVLLDPPGGVYVQGTVVTLTALPGPGFVFKGWSGDATGISPTVSLVMDRAKSVLATFGKAR